MDQPVTFKTPRSRFQAALWGIAPGLALIAIATGIKFDPQAASAFSGDAFRANPHGMRDMTPVLAGPGAFQQPLNAVQRLQSAQSPVLLPTPVSR